MRRSSFNAFRNDYVFSRIAPELWSYILAEAERTGYIPVKQSRRELAVGLFLDEFGWKASDVGWLAVAPLSIVHQVIHARCANFVGTKVKGRQKTILLCENLASSADVYFASLIVHEFGPNMVTKHFKTYYPFSRYFEVSRHLNRSYGDFLSHLKRHDPFILYKKVVEEVGVVQALTQECFEWLVSESKSGKQPYEDLCRSMEELPFAEFSTYLNHLQQLLYARFHCEGNSDRQDILLAKTLQRKLSRSNDFLSFLKSLEA